MNERLILPILAVIINPRNKDTVNNQNIYIHDFVFYLNASNYTKIDPRIVWLSAALYALLSDYSHV